MPKLSVYIAGNSGFALPIGGNSVWGLGWKRQQNVLVLFNVELRITKSCLFYSLGRKKYFSRQAVKILSAGSKNSLGRKKSPNSKVVHIVKFSLSNGHFQIDFDILTAALFFSINLHFCF